MSTGFFTKSILYFTKREDEYEEAERKYGRTEVVNADREWKFGRTEGV